MVFNKNYRLSSSEEESKGIDGYIGNIPISIKPTSYKQENFLPESINIHIVYYEKQKDGLKIFIPENLEELLRNVSN